MAHCIVQALLRRGPAREHNSDNLYLGDAWVPFGQRASFSRALATEEAVQLYAVAGGIGGSGCDDLAAETALAVLARHGQQLKAGRGGFDLAAFAWAFAEEANALIYRLLEPNLGLQAGTTLAVLLLIGGQACTIGIGNSTVFLLRAGRLQDLSREEGASNGPGPSPAFLGLHDRQQLARAIRIKQIALQTGDRFLLATNGITDLLAPTDLKAVLTAPGIFVRQLDKLWQQIEQTGSADNLATIHLRVLSLEETAAKPHNRRLLRRRVSAPTGPRLSGQEMLRAELAGSRWFWWLLYGLALVLAALAAGKLFRLLQPWLKRIIASF